MKLITQEEITKIVGCVQDPYTLMGTTLCDEVRQDNVRLNLELCFGCISRVPCILKNVLKEVNKFNLVLTPLLGQNITIQMVSPHLILLADLLFKKEV